MLIKVIKFAIKFKIFDFHYLHIPFCNFQNSVSEKMWCCLTFVCVYMYMPIMQYSNFILLCRYLLGGSHLVPLKMNSAADPLSLFCSIQLDTVLLYIYYIPLCRYLLRGSHLVPLKMNSAADPFSPFCSVLQPDTVLLQVNYSISYL